MRINKPWKVHQWLPVFLAMPKMLKELESDPASGFLGHNRLSRVIVQYWRSFEHLETYARSKEMSHWPAWVDFNRKVGNSHGDVGIWHAGTLRSDLQRHAPVRSGVGKLVPASGNRDSAKSRMTVAALSE